MKNILLLGAGAMGEGLLGALSTENSYQVKLIDTNQQRLDFLTNKMSKLNIEPVRISDFNQVCEHLNSIDIALLCLPWPVTYQYLPLLAQHKVPTASITRAPNDVIEEVDSLYKQTQTPILMPCGLEPGLVEILSAYAIGLTRYDCTSLITYCGGITNKPREPFNYTRVFGSVLPFDMRDAFYRQNGKTCVTKRFSDVKSVYVENCGMLESYHDGLIPAMMALEPFNSVPNIQQRSLRWPGFAKRVNQLHELQLFDNSQHVEINGQIFSLKELTNKLFFDNTQLAENETDKVILIVQSQYQKQEQLIERKIEVVVQPKATEQITAMAHVTGKALYIGAKQLLDSGETGLNFPHVLLRNNIVTFLDELQDDYILINQVV